MNQELENMARIVAGSPRYRVLTLFQGDELVRLDSVPPGASVGIVLDTETTGKDAHTDKLIELGMVKFAFDSNTGHVLGVLAQFDKLEDPGLPIPADAFAVNGITDEMVCGQRIEDDEVLDFIDDVDVIIAHNAGFDRVICELRFPFFKHKVWACSYTQVSWSSLGITSAKLEYIAYCLEFFYSAHRAEQDCLALLYALSKGAPNDKTGAPILLHLVNAYKLSSYRLWAVSAPFDKKDVLKSRGYRWSDGSRPGSEKAWYADIPEASYEEELSWMQDAIWGGRAYSLLVSKLDGYNRFSAQDPSRERVYR
jgi:DNA polymerase III subunit epsilon